MGVFFYRGPRSTAVRCVVGIVAIRLRTKPQTCGELRSLNCRIVSENTAPIDGGADLYSYGGTVFQIDSNRNESVVYSFCSLPGRADGTQPEGPVIEDASGNPYGMTYAGGTVYEIKIFKTSR